MEDKKGMEMGVQTLIYVAIGIAILAISLIVYFGVVSDGQETIRSCENAIGGQCVADASRCAGTINRLGQCTDGGVCCVQ